MAIRRTTIPRITTLHIMTMDILLPIPQPMPQCYRRIRIRMTMEQSMTPVHGEEVKDQAVRVWSG
jgi:hypothetical protein